MGICEQCKVNEGVVFFRSIIGSTGQDFLVCEECLKKLTGGNDPIAYVKGSLITNSQNAVSQADEEVDGIMDMRCDKCDTSLGDISQTNKFGCEHCYVVFSDLLNIADCQITVGKKEAQHHATVMTSQLDRLKVEMKKAINGEQYEKAARLRDQIREIQNKPGEEL